MALEKIDLTCPKCGGNMEPDADNKRLHCPYCGHEVIIKNDDAKSLEEKAYARQRGILHANEEAERKKKIKKMRRTLIIVGVVLAFIAAAIIYGASQPKVDPFRYITVSFSGTSGSGEAEIIVQPEPDGDVDPQSISYSLDKHYFLFEGDTVTVTAYSSEYTLSPLTKTYKVTGLDTYLTDINSISEKAVEMIHNKSDMTADMAVSGPGTSVKVKSLKPCAMFLATDGKKNTLYDIYKAKFKEKNSGYAERYIVIYYKNIIVRDTEEPTMSYDSTMYTGQIVEALDNSYGGYVTGYKKLKDARADILSHQKKAVTLQKRE